MGPSSKMGTDYGSWLEGIRSQQDSAKAVEASNFINELSSGKNTTAIRTENQLSVKSAQNKMRGNFKVLY